LFCSYRGCSLNYQISVKVGSTALYNYVLKCSNANTHDLYSPRADALTTGKQSLNADKADVIRPY